MSAGLDNTNNMSEKLHNGFLIVFAKHHPDLHSALKEFQKEQSDTDVRVLKLTLGRSIRDVPQKNGMRVKREFAL